MEKKRNVGLEYLRIFSMFLIILLHSIDHSGLRESLVPGTALYVWETFLYGLCQVCVNCFVMLSGYFRSAFRPGKLVRLWTQVVFYALGVKLVLMGLGVIEFSLVSLLSCFAPFLTGRYWFVTIYFGLYLLSPFLNIWVDALDRLRHGLLNLLLFFLMSCMVSIYPGFLGMNTGGGWGLAWFVTLYLLAAWLGKYGIPLKNRGWIYGLGYLVCGLLLLGATLLTDRLGFPLLTKIVKNWYRYDSVFSWAGSVCLFCAFGCWKGSRCPRWVRAASSATFGVYLLHAHANVCVSAFWQGLGILRFSLEPWFPVYQLGLTAAIFAVCAGVELLRQRLLRRWKGSILFSHEVP